jgi:hypothetical protein
VATVGDIAVGSVITEPAASCAEAALVLSFMTSSFFCPRARRGEARTVDRSSAIGTGDRDNHRVIASAAQTRSILGVRTGDGRSFVVDLTTQGTLAENADFARR